MNEEKQLLGVRIEFNDGKYKQYKNIVKQGIKEYSVCCLLGIEDSLGVIHHINLSDVRSIKVWPQLKEVEE